MKDALKIEKSPAKKKKKKDFLAAGITAKDSYSVRLHTLFKQLQSTVFKY